MSEPYLGLLIGAAPDLAVTPNVRAALSAACGNPAPTAASEGDLARAALDFLAPLSRSQSN